MVSALIVNLLIRAGLIFTELTAELEVATNTIVT